MAVEKFLTQKTDAKLAKGNKLEKRKKLLK